MLKLGSNHLFDLPHEFCKLPNIEEIQLYGNEMPRLPVSLNVKGHKEALNLLSLLVEYFPPPSADGTAADLAQGAVVGLLGKSRSSKIANLLGATEDGSAGKGAGPKT